MTADRSREGVERLLKHVEQIAEAALERNELQPARAKLLAAMLGDMRAYSRPLFATVESGDDPQLREFAYECLWRILGAAHIIGTQLGPDPRTEEALAHAVRDSQVRQARSALARQTSARHTQLRAAIFAAAERTKATKLVASRPFADSLMEDVHAILGTAKGASAASIEREIAAILKDGAKP